MNNDIITLKQFIDENINLITATGVFGALTAYFSSSDIYKENILFLFFIGVIFLILCIELKDNLPDWNQSSKNLKIFLVAFLFITLTIYTTLLFQIHDIINLYLKWILMLIYLYGINYLLHKLKLIKKIEHSITIGTEKNIVLGFILIMSLFLIILILIFLLASLTEEYVRNFLTMPIIES